MSPSESSALRLAPTSILVQNKNFRSILFFFQIIQLETPASTLKPALLRLSVASLRRLPPAVRAGCWRFLRKGHICNRTKLWDQSWQVNKDAMSKVGINHSSKWNLFLQCFYIFWAQDPALQSARLHSFWPGHKFSPQGQQKDWASQGAEVSWHFSDPPIPQLLTGSQKQSAMKDAKSSNSVPDIEKDGW